MRKSKKRSRSKLEHRRKVAEKRRARAFWKLREQYSMEAGREFAPPPMPKWMRRGYVAAAGVLAGLAMYLAVKLFT
jgi:hypothetical protein